MSAGGPPSRGQSDDLIEAGAAEPQVLLLHKEHVSVAKRVRKTLVRAVRSTTTRDTVVEEDLHHDHVVVERVAIGRIVDAVPPIRQEGEVTILSVVEEVLVVERRLILKEEVHMRRVQRTERFVQTVSLREQDVTLTRRAIED